MAVAMECSLAEEEERRNKEKELEMIEEEALRRALEESLKLSDSKV
jgi:hypothetical protein